MRHKPPSVEMPPLTLTPTQVCEVLQIGRETFDIWSHRAGFPVIREGRTILVPIESLRQWVIEQAATTNGVPAPLAPTPPPPAREPQRGPVRITGPETGDDIRRRLASRR